MPRKIADMMNTPQVRKSWNCLKCGRSHPSVEAVRECDCHAVSELGARELERAVLAGEREETLTDA